MVPLKRRVDKAERLHCRGKALVREGTQRVDGIMLVQAYAILGKAMWWYCTPGMLETRSQIWICRGRWVSGVHVMIYLRRGFYFRTDLAYVDTSEALALYAHGKKPIHLEGIQLRHLTAMGFPIDSRPEDGELPTPTQVIFQVVCSTNDYCSQLQVRYNYRVEDWPTDLHLERVITYSSPICWTYAWPMAHLSRPRCPSARWRPSP